MDWNHHLRGLFHICYCQPLRLGFPATPGSTTLRTDDMPWITDHVIADDKQTLSRSVIHMEKS